MTEKLILFTEDAVIGTASLWLQESRKNILLAIPKLRLEHDAVIRLVSGASIPELFCGCSCRAGESVFHPISVLSGEPDLFITGEPVMRNVIVSIRTGTHPPVLSDALTRGVKLLKGCA